MFLVFVFSFLFLFGGKFRGVLAEDVFPVHVGDLNRDNVVNLMVSYLLYKHLEKRLKYSSTAGSCGSVERLGSV